MTTHLSFDGRYSAVRQKILEEAYKIVVNQGIEHLSMRSIAAAVKSSPANLYEYFLNKDEIVYELYTRVMSELADDLYAVDPQLPLMDYLEQVGVAYLNFVQNRSVLFRLHGHYDIEQGMGVDAGASLGPARNVDPLPTRAQQLFDVLQSAIQRHHMFDQQAVEASKIVQTERLVAYWALLHGYATLMWLSVEPAYTPEKWRALFRQFFAIV